MINRVVGFKVLIFPLAMALVVMMSVLYIKPAYDEMQFMRISRTEKQQELKNLQIQNQKLAELKMEWDSMENERTLILTALPSMQEMENYLAELYGRASRSGILLNSITSSEKNIASKPYVCGSSVSLLDSVSDIGSSVDVEMSGNAAPTASKSCAKAASVNLAVTGNWDQLINFFKYLEDTNRIANISSVAINASAQKASEEQPPSDLLSATVDLTVFYKGKSEVGGNSNVVSSLTSGKGFEENVIKKLNEIIFTPYVAPVVSESGERNIFK